MSDIINVKHFDQYLTQNKSLINNTYYCCGFCCYFCFLLLGSLYQRSRAWENAHLDSNWSTWAFLQSAAHSSPPLKLQVSKMFWLECKSEVIADNRAWFALVMQVIKLLPSAQLKSALVDDCFKVQDWARLRRGEWEDPSSQPEVMVLQREQNDSVQCLGPWWVWGPYV